MAAEEEVGLSGTAETVVQTGNCASSRSALGLDGSSKEKQKGQVKKIVIVTHQCTSMSVLPLYSFLH